MRMLSFTSAKVLLWNIFTSLCMTAYLSNQKEIIPQDTHLKFRLLEMLLKV